MQEGCLLYGGRSFYYVTGIIASLLIDVFEDNSTECERQGRYDKIICKLRKQKKNLKSIIQKLNHYLELAEKNMNICWNMGALVMRIELGLQAIRNLRSIWNMKPKFVHTKNVKGFINLIQDLKNKPENITKIGLVYGNAGLGKTKTALYLSFQFDSIYIRATNKMTTKWFLEELAKELDEIPRFFTADIFRQCVNVLKNKPQMIIVDEIDYLLSDFKTIETLRDLHDETVIPIVLVGMSLAKHKLKKHTHLFDRISEIYQYTEFEYSDIKQIVDEISEVDMTKEVISVIHQKAKSFRKIVEMINTLENIALVNGIKLIDENIIQEVFR